jgi:AcrR family transcriptional regulator
VGPGEGGNAGSTRSRILDAAARLFVERGFAGTSVREIAAAIGISNPSLYHHFSSKGDLLEQLLAEPLARSQKAVEEAYLLTGEARTRRIVTGLLEAMEVHSGVAVAALRHAGSTESTEHDLVAGTRPLVYGLLMQEAAEDDADLRVRMAVGAVERVVVDLMLDAEDGDRFVADLRARRDAIVDLAVKLLRG